MAPGAIRQRSSRLLGLFSQLNREHGEVKFICTFEKELANGYEARHYDFLEGIRSVLVIHPYEDLCEIFILIFKLTL